MVNLCQIELLKSKHTFQRFFLLIGPIVFGVLLLLATNIAPDAMDDAWGHYTKLIFNMWAMAFNTLGISLLCILSEQREKRSKSYRLFFVESTSLTKIWVSKVLTLALYTLLATIILAVFVILLALFHQLDISYILDILSMGALSWITSLSVIPVILCLSYYFSILIPLAVGCFGFISAPMMAATSYWVFNPFSYSTRAIVPITKIQPNAVTISGYHALLNSDVIIISIVLTIILLFVFSWITALFFRKSEVV